VRPDDAAGLIAMKRRTRWPSLSRDHHHALVVAQSVEAAELTS
jgi:hypothetical protein